MNAFRIIPNSGVIPRLDAKNLPEGAAQEAANVTLTAGRAEPIYRPKTVQSYGVDTVQTIYRMFNDSESYWLTWEEQVDIAESPVYVENNFRIAFTSPDFEPRQTDLSLASVGATSGNYPENWYVLGVTPPTTKPTVSSVTGGAPPLVSRVYLYTFVTQWGEESAPSPNSDIFTGNASGAWNLTLPDIAPANTYAISAVTYISGQLRLTFNSTFGLRAKETIIVSGLDAAINGKYRVASVDKANNYVFIKMPDPGTIVLVAGTADRVSPHNTTGMTKRVYRSITTVDGTQYFLVGSNIPAATTTFVDDATVIGEPISTIGWGMPPADLEGITTHPSGAMIGFVGNQIYISEPYMPYAWPLANVSVLDFPVVAISISGQSAIIGTTGEPYALTFTDPLTATPQKLDQNWPCLSKRGMVGFSDGVYYPSVLGLVLVSASGPVLVTKTLYAQRDWAATKPETFKAGFYDGQYYALYTKDNATRIIIISETYGVSQLNISADAIFTDRQTGEVYVAKDKKIDQLNAATEGALDYTWTSKTYILPEPINLGAAKLDFNTSSNAVNIELINAANAGIKAQNDAIIAGDSLDGSIAVNDVLELAVADSNLIDFVNTDGAEYCSFTLIVDEKPIYTTNVPDNRAFRLPSGIKYDNFAIRISGTAKVTAILTASTMTLLKAV